MKRLSAFVFLLFFIFIRYSYCQETNILLIGNSILEFNDLHYNFQVMAERANKNAYIDANIRVGMSLEDHANSIQTYEKIKLKDWDYVLIQGNLYISNPARYHLIKPIFNQLKDSVEKYSSDPEIIIMMPMSYEDGITWLEGYHDTWEQVQVNTYTGTIQFAREEEIIIAPVGWAWYNALKADPTIDLYTYDLVHSTQHGSYLTLCTIYSTIFNERTDTITFYDNIPEAEAKFLQTIASNTVIDDWDLWTKTSGYPTSNFNDVDILTINLKQNYPNPFSIETNIEFNIDKSTRITLNLYDLNGSLVKTVLNEKIIPGNYNIPFNRNNLNSGIYIYELITKDRVLTKKMMIID